MSLGCSSCAAAQSSSSEGFLFSELLISKHTHSSVSVFSVFYTFSTTFGFKMAEFRRRFRTIPNFGRPDTDKGPEDVEVQFMDDLSCIIGGEQAAGTGKQRMVDAADKQSLLLDRVRLLEHQVASCLQNQALVARLVDKCTQLEESVGAIKQEMEERMRFIVEPVEGDVQVPVVAMDNEETEPDYEAAVTFPAQPKDSMDSCSSSTAETSSIDVEGCSEVESNGDGDDQSGREVTPTNHINRSGAVSEESPPPRQNLPSCRKCRATEQPHKGTCIPSISPVVPRFGPPAAPTRANVNWSSLICLDCEQKFAQRFTIDRHIQSIHSAPTLSCQFCKKLYGRQDHLHNHRKRTHAKDWKASTVRLVRHRNPQSPIKVRQRTQRRHECKHCGAKFEAERTLRYHLRVEHQSGN